MDFMNLIKGIEALLYECLSWLVFYPLTMWRVLTRPLGMMRYAETEITTLAADKPRFDDAMSPPIFLVVTLFIALAAQRSAGTEAPAMAGALADTQNQLMFRAIVFGLFPLLLALLSVRLRGVTLTRQSLQPAFYAQCLVAGPAILATGMVTPLAHQGDIGLWAGVAIAVLGLCWYLIVQTRWVRLVGTGWLRAALLVLGTSLMALALGIVLSSLALMAVAAF